MSEQARPDPEPVWGGTVDGDRFTAMVVQTGDDAYAGRLTVVVTETNEEVLSEEVGIAYGAPFGPDVADVMSWQQKTIEAIDGWLTAHGETPPPEAS